MNLDKYPALLRTSEVAAIFRVNPKAVQRWAADGKLPCVKTPGGHRRFRREVVQALLDAPDIHRSYEHPGFGPACGVCSPAAGMPVAWDSCRAGR